jgi:hypothetical protein
MESNGPLLREHRGRRLRLLAVLSLLAVGFLVHTLAVTGFGQPGPIRTLQWNRERIEHYIFNIYADLIPQREDGQGYYVLDVLADADARYVRREGDSVVISFAFLPPDAVPVLIYSPSGWAGVPERYRPGGSRRGEPETWEVFDFRQIDGRWFYCCWDF